MTRLHKMPRPTHGRQPSSVSSPPEPGGGIEGEPFSGPAQFIVVDGQQYMKVGKKKAGRYLHPFGELSETPGEIA